MGGGGRSLNLHYPVLAPVHRVTSEVRVSKFAALFWKETHFVVATPKSELLLTEHYREENLKL